MLKNILVNCTDLSFSVKYAHVPAHQDDYDEYSKLLRPAQLNCFCDGMAKEVVWGWAGEDLPPQRVFPLEPMAVYVGADKMTTYSGGDLRFWVHKQLAEDVFYQLGLMSLEYFQEVAWRQVYGALHEVPRMFQVWACKQVTNIAGMNANQAKYKKDHDPICPSCSTEVETCCHVLFCEESGGVQVLGASIKLLDQWLKSVGTDTGMRRRLIAYARRRGGVKMSEMVWGERSRLRKLGQSMDAIGWRQFMEGVVSRKALDVQAACVDLGRCTLSLNNLVKGLVVKLKEITHGR